MFVPIVLVDIQTLDGTQYFWSDYEGTYPTKFSGANQLYRGWIKAGCNFTRTKDMSSNAGDLLLQNLSGNTIDRDVATALKNHEFEGAYAVTRLWIPLLDVAIDEFHCSLTEQESKEDEAAARLLQLFDPAQYVVGGDVEVETCTWRFKSLQCGSTGSATFCPKRLIDCQDATRAAQERFNAILTTVPNTVFTQPPGPQVAEDPGEVRGNGPRTPNLE
jgi:phage-related protein